MKKNDKESLIAIGDTIMYKCEQLDIRTFSPTISDYKIAKIIQLNKERIKLDVVASRDNEKKSELKS